MLVRYPPIVTAVVMGWSWICFSSTSRYDVLLLVAGTSTGEVAREGTGEFSEPLPLLPSSALVTGVEVDEPVRPSELRPAITKNVTLFTLRNRPRSRTIQNRNPYSDEWHPWFCRPAETT